MGDDLDDFINALLAPKPQPVRTYNNKLEARMEVRSTDKLKVIKRELALRRRNYPKWVAAGKMKQKEAEEQLRIMEAILADYEREAQQLEVRFFGDED